MKKLKISLSIVAICLSIAVFCFGVFAATQVTYSIGGTVSYTVTDALVEIKTRVYSSKERATSDTKLLAMSNYLTNKTYIENAIENGTLTEITKYSDGRLDVNTLQDQREPAIYPDQTADTKINIDYSNSNYTWYIVVSITNIADNIVWANVSKQSFTGDFNSYSNYTAGIDSIAKDETKTIVIGFSVKDEKTSIKDATFDYSLTISADQSAKPELDTNPRIESLGKYYTEKNVNIPLSTSAYSTSLAVEHDGDATVSETTTFGSVLNFKVPANTSNFDFKFDLVLSMGNDKLNLSQISDSDISNLFKEIKILNNNVSNFVTTYGTSEYLNAKDCEISLDPIENSENKIFTCKVKNITSENISVVFAYGPLANTIYALFNSESLDFDTLQLQIQTTAESDLIEINTISETSIPMQNIVDGADTMYYFSYVTNVPTNAQQLKFSLSTPLQVTDSSDATKKVNVLTLIQPMPLKGNYPTYESVVSAMGSDESWLDNNRLNPTTYSQSEDGSIIGAFPCGGLKQVTFFVLFDLSAEQIKELQDQGYDITKAFNCNVEITYMGISEDADTVKLNTIEKTEHLTIKKAYLEGEEGNFTFDRSGNYYYQNFQVKNYFDKYDEMHLYLGGMEGEYSILKGNRDSIGSELTDIIATINSRNGIVTLTKDMGEYFCLVATSSQFKMTMKPSLENVTFEYKILADNTVSITKYWDNGAKSLTIPESIDGHIVSTIGENALRNVGSLTKLVVPDTVTKISDYSLYSPNLTDVTLPFLAGLYDYGWDFLPFPNKLETLTLTKNGELLNSAGTNGTTSNLKTIVFSDDIEKINIYNSDFANVQNISFGNKVKSIKIGSQDCNLVKNNTSNGLTIFTSRDNGTKFLYKVDSSLTTVTKEQLAGVKIINEGAFSSCDALTSVEIPVGVKELPERLFDTPNLTSLSLPSTISYIGSNAFVSRNNSGSDINIPWYSNLSCDVNGLKIVNAYDDANVKFLLGSDSNKVTGTTLTSAILNGVKVVYDNALSYCYSVEKIELPNTVVYIGNSAFNSCRNLKSINIPSNVIEIGSSAFYYTSITNIKIPGGISEIKDNTFQSCDKLTTVSLPNSLKKIGSSAFYYCELLNNINLPNGLEYIGENAFGSCKALENIYIPESVNYIGGGDYQGYWDKYPILCGCSSLSKIVVSQNNKKYTSANSNCIIDKETGILINGCKSSTIPSIVKEIGAYAFYNSKIENVVIPSSVEIIDDWAFTACKKLVTISLPNGIKEIGYNAFNSTSLEKVILPDSITSLGSYLFHSCSSLQSVVLPKNISSISANMFSGCKSLTSITIPSSVTAIYEDAFEDSGLTSIKIPSCVKSIDDNAFSRASNLQKIELPSSLEYIGNNAFYYTKYFNNMQADGNGLKIASAYDNNDVKYVLGYSPNSSNPSITADMLKGVQVFQRDAFNNRTFETFEVPNTLKRFLYLDVFKNSTINTLKIPSRFFSAFRDISVKNFILTSDDTEIIDEHYSSDYKNSESIEIASAIKELKLGDNYNDEHGSLEQLKTITFAENSQLESIEIGSSMKNLTTLNLPKNIKYLKIAKETAWYKNLTADENGLIIVPSSEDASVKYLVGYNADTLNANITAEMLNGVTVFADSIFNNCKKLASIEIPSTVDIIPSYAFDGCTNLQNITFKGIIKKVGNYAFDDVTITSMRFPVGLEQVGRNIFGGYRSSTINVELPSTLTEIEDDAFEYIFSEDGNGLIITTAYDNPNYRFLLGAKRDTVKNKSITLDMIKNVKVIADWALNDMDIKSIEIPSDIVKIGDGALARIDTLNEITMSGENERYAVEGNCLVDKKTKTLMVAGRKCTIPQDLGIEVIDDYAFYRLNNSSFKDSKNIVIPNTVKKIGHNAFGFQDNLTITMPTSIEYLDEILWNSNNITVIYQGTLAQWNEITIRGNSSKNATIICTDGETTAAL